MNLHINGFLKCLVEKYNLGFQSPAQKDEEYCVKAREIQRWVLCMMRYITSPNADLLQ